MTYTPSFYKKENAGNWNYNPNIRQLVEEARDFKRHTGIADASSDKKRVALLLIDAQRDFCHTEGTLFVGGRSGRGAVDDNERTAQFIYREMANLTSVIPTMDTHEAFQIFTPSFWVDQYGAMLLPHDMIDGNMNVIRAGNNSGLRASVNHAVLNDLPLVGEDVAWLKKQTEFYVKELARKGKYMLYIWPEHCVLGSIGHTLVGVINEARLFHSYVRNAQNSPHMKGGHPLTENYSIFGPEVVDAHDGGVIAEKNDSFLDLILRYDAVLIAGQASSHCVKSSIDDLLEEIQKRDKTLARKVYILRDLMSAVVVPGVVDFTEDAEKALQRYADSGMHIVSSIDPMSSWLA